MATTSERINTKISFYKNTFDTNNDVETGIDEFLHDVLTGKYQDLVLAVRIEKDKDKRSALKKKSLPCVSVSGSFSARNDSSLRAHSGFLAIDIDNLNEEKEAVKSILIQDPFVYAAFDSVSGNGLCVIFKIEGERHADAFEAISAYLYNNYQVIVDPSGKNISRLRYASYDPALYSTDKPIVFKKYLPKSKPKPVNRIVFVKTEFDAIISEFAERHINICEDYRDWVLVGYAIASKFGPSGEDYFHTLSSQSSKYDENNTRNLYAAICKTETAAKEKRASIATIYYFAKLNNIQTYSVFTQEIIKTTTTLKKSGLKADAIARNIEEFEGVSKDDTIDIITQAIDNKVEIEDGGSIVEECERWLQYNTKLKYNEITRLIENDGVPQYPMEFNSLFIGAKKVIEKLDYSLFERIILSNNTPKFNPFIEWFRSYEGRTPSGTITALAKTIETLNPDYAEKFITKWLVGMVSAIHGQHSPLMLILAGEKQNTGKTEWFRRLLPRDLHSKYFSNSKLDKGKDDEILMCQKLVVFDDEMAGKSKKDNQKMKNITSADYFSLREPYGRGNVTLRRLAVLCGSTNELELLDDPTGNRRFLPIEVISIDHAAYNKIDKIDLLMEAYHLYKSGFNWELNSDDIKYLRSNTEQFEVIYTEKELIQKYFRVPGPDDHSMSIKKMTNTDILLYIQSKIGSSVRVGSKTLTQMLKKLGFVQVISGGRFFMVVENESTPSDVIPF
ncbi:VapE domain-containing protein [Pedobacter sp. AW1-32]|uniref:VapE domain-containing protein n=1 Tax=Pedobacter sp. AW1-32 TaxID=3383026 RepID=UPI003FEFA25B